MSELCEIRWHGRGGQGVVTAAQLLAQSALVEGKHFQSFPEFGPERMGAPIRAFSRVSAEQINLYCNVDNPNMVVVLDPTLIGQVNLTEGLADGGAVIVNTSEDPAAVKQRLGVKNGKVFTVDATAIAKNEIGRPIPNTPMLGALIKASGVLKLDTVSKHLRESFGGKFSADVVEGNVKALTRAYEEVKSV
jgi:pyruvate ferredoxin oxidoreductase gamma subunit